MNTQQRSRVSAKKLEIYLKKNLTGDEIATKLGFDSSSDLDSAMKKTFSPSVYEYYRGRVNKKSSKKATSKKKIAPTPEPVEALVEEDSRPTLEELRELEAEQQLKTVDCEVAVKAVRQRAKDNLNAIAALKEKIDEWKVMIDNGLSEITSLEDESIDILADHEDALKALHEAQDKLQSIRDQIEDRSVVFVLVDANNDFETEMDGSSVELVFGDWDPFYQSIIALGPEKLENLTIGQIVMVAKMLSLPAGQAYDITFELDEAQKLYSFMKESTLS